jgi:cystathionine gamma-synthase
MRSARVQGAKLLWLESPAIRVWMCAIYPLLAEAAHAAGALVVVDNTTATCLGQQPLSRGS